MDTSTRISCQELYFSIVDKECLFFHVCLEKITEVTLKTLILT